MDSLKETDNLATKPSKRPRIEVDEELMRQMIAGQAPLDSKVIRRIPEPEAENTDAPEGKTSETVSGASAPTAERTDANTQTSDVKELAGFRRKKIPLPDFERTFFAPADCRNRSAIYISAATKYKVSAILHLLGMRIQGLQLWSQYAALCNRNLQRRVELSPREEEQQTTILNRQCDKRLLWVSDMDVAKRLASEPQNVAFSTIATSKTPGMEIRNTRPRAIRNGLAYFHLRRLIDYRRETCNRRCLSD